MIASEQSDYGGWRIQASCNEVKPSDWRPGMPVSYAAHLEATLTRQFSYPDIHPGIRRFTIPEHGNRNFADWNEAYRVLKREAHDRIDEMGRM